MEAAAYLASSLLAKVRAAALMPRSGRSSGELEALPGISRTGTRMRIWLFPACALTGRTSLL